MTWVNIEPAAKIAAARREARGRRRPTTRTGLPFYEKAVGKGNVVMMPWADFGFDMYSHVDHRQREDDEGAARRC